MNSSNIESRENIHVLYAEKQNLSKKVIIVYLSVIIPKNKYHLRSPLADFDGKKYKGKQQAILSILK